MPESGSPACLHPSELLDAACGSGGPTLRSKTGCRVCGLDRHEVALEEGVSMLLVEQNLKLAEAVADVIYVMVKGQMVYSAPLEKFCCERADVEAKYLTL